MSHSGYVLKQFRVGVSEGCPTACLLVFCCELFLFYCVVKSRSWIITAWTRPFTFWRLGYSPGLRGCGFVNCLHKYSWLSQCKIFIVLGEGCLHAVPFSLLSKVNIFISAKAINYMRQNQRLTLLVSQAFFLFFS